jgi:hypothetical protein
MDFISKDGETFICSSSPSKKSEKAYGKLDSYVTLLNHLEFPDLSLPHSRVSPRPREGNNENPKHSEARVSLAPKARGERASEVLGGGGERRQGSMDRPQVIASSHSPHPFDSLVRRLMPRVGGGTCPRSADFFDKGS